MASLKALYESLHFQNVRTYIQSGNIVFKAEENNRQLLAEKISRSIEKQFNFKPKVLLLEAAELDTAIKNNPFPTEDGKTLHFSFLESIPESPDLGGLNALKADSEEFKLYNNVFYLYAPDGIGRSKLAMKIEKSLGVECTARNWNTVAKLLKMIKQK